jgi:hypothetical protein
VETGTVFLQNDALLEFQSGQINTINGELFLDGANARVADVSDTTHNSALTGLTSVASVSGGSGFFFLQNGASVNPSGNLTISGNGMIELDGPNIGGGGGSSLTVGGTLTNSSTNGNGLDIGNTGISSADSLTVNGSGGLSNTGVINLAGGSASATANLRVNGAATNSGTVNINSFSELAVTGGNTYTQTVGNTTVAGTLAAATINVTSGAIDFSSALVSGGGTGAIEVGGNAIAEFGAAVDAAQTMTFTSAAATIELGAPGQFGGTIDSLVVGDTIDLLQTAVTGLSYANGVLTVQNGSTTVATLNLPGGFSTSDFVFTSDNNSGTDIRLAGNAAQATIEKASGSGNFAQNGTSYTLDFGTIAQNSTSPTADLEVLNSATAPSDLLSGSFTIANSSGFSNSGFSSFSGLAAGQADTAPAITLGTGTAGTFSQTITLVPASSNAGGSSALPNETLTVTGTVTGPQSGTLAITAPPATTLGVGQPGPIAGVSIAESPTTSGETFTVILTDTNGLLSATGTGVSGSGTTSLLITGSLVQVNNDLATLTDTDATAPLDTLAITAGDSNGGKVTPAQIALTVNGLPAIAAPASTTVTQNQATPVSGISLSESGNTTTSGETFTVTLTDTNGDLSATGSGVSGAGTASLTITGSLARVNSDLATVTDGDASTALDTIKINASDSFGNKATLQAVTVSVTTQSGKPSITAPPSQAVTATVPTLLTPISVADPSAGSGPLTVTVSDSIGTLSATVAGAGTVSGAGGKTLTLTGELPDVNAELANVTYDAATAGTDTVTVRATDPLGSTAAASISITAAALPAAITPVINAPTNIQLLAGMPTGVGGFSISDPSAQAAGTPVTFDLSLPGGTLTLTGPAGPSITGQGTSNLSITGTIAQINADFSDGLFAVPRSRRRALRVDHRHPRRCQRGRQRRIRCPDPSGGHRLRRADRFPERSPRRTL